VGFAAAAWIAGVPACSSSGEDATSSEEIYGGIRDDDVASSPSPVVALRIAKTEICSGILVAPNVVLTARHCVSKSETDTVVCDEEGRALSGRLTGDLPPADIAVYVGTTPAFGDKPVAVAKEIFTPEESVVCNADLALVVLDVSLAKITPVAVRLGAPPRLNETIRAVGYGKNDGKAPIGTRFRRDRVPVLAVGKAVTASNTRLGPREFEVGRSVCDGDSGGPAISELTGAVVGVVSRGGACNADQGHVYTTTAGFDALFEKAFAAAEQPKIVEQNTPPEVAAPAQQPAPASSSPAARPNSGGDCLLSPRSKESEGGGSVAAVLALAVTVLARRRKPR